MRLGEYHYEIGLQTQLIHGRTDVTVGEFSFAELTEPKSHRPVFYLKNLFQNQSFPFPRIATSEPHTRLMDAFVECPGAPVGRRMWQETSESAFFSVGFYKLSCALLGGPYCNWDRTFLDGRKLIYGWELYEARRPTRPSARPGIFSDGAWELQQANSGILSLTFGQPGDVPVVGDWDGDGSTDLGVFRASTLKWYLDNDLDGKAERVFSINGMTADDIPVAGDWDGDGKYTTGYFRGTDNSWHLLQADDGIRQWPVFQLGVCPSISQIDGNRTNEIEA